MSACIICGGREFFDRTHIDLCMDFWNEQLDLTLVATGGAMGADTLASDWARRSGIETWTLFANWKKHGDRAGLIRNEQMLSVIQPRYVFAFPGGAGTAHMVGVARKAGIAVITNFRVKKK